MRLLAKANLPLLCTSHPPRYVLDRENLTMLNRYGTARDEGQREKRSRLYKGLKLRSSLHNNQSLFKAR